MHSAEKKIIVSPKTKKLAVEKVFVGVLFIVLLVALVALPQHAATPSAASAATTSATPSATPSATTAATAQQSQSMPGMDMSLPSGPEPVPAYHTQLPNSPLPQTLDPQLFTAVVVQNAYTLAARVKKLLYQQPCYCHCDQSQGHGSLLDCFAGKHGSNCNVCMAEDFYTYEQSRKGKTAAQIRAGITSGEWKNVDLAKYQQPLPLK
jgi:hypothetical protein